MFAGGQQYKNMWTNSDNDFCHSHFGQKVGQYIAQNSNFQVIADDVHSGLCLFNFGLSRPAAVWVGQCGRGDNWLIQTVAP